MSITSLFINIDSVILWSSLSNTHQFETASQHQHCLVRGALLCSEALLRIETFTSRVKRVKGSFKLMTENCKK